jgi:hypothetical protein
MKMAPERPTPLLLFSAWCGIFAGALWLISSLATYGLRAGWAPVPGFLLFVTGLGVIDRNRRAKRGAPADPSRRENVNGGP